MKLGYVDESYVDAMQEREKLVSTYMGMGVAIPHGTTQAKGTVKKTGIVFLQYPEGVDFGAERLSLYLELLESAMSIWISLENSVRCLKIQLLETLKTTDDVKWVLEQLS